MIYADKQRNIIRKGVFIMVSVNDNELNIFERIINDKVDFIDWRFDNYYTTKGKVYDGEEIKEIIKNNKNMY